MLIILIISVLLAYIGVQASIQDLKLLYGKYNYGIGIVQIFTYLSLSIGVISVLYDIAVNDLFLLLIAYSACYPYTIVMLWIQAKINSRIFTFNCLYQLLSIILFYMCAKYMNVQVLGCAYIMGFIFRNNKYSCCPFIKKLLIFSNIKKVIWTKEYDRGVVFDNVDFSNAGCKQNTRSRERVYNVVEYGILPNSSEDSIEKLQSLIDWVGAKGGGEIYFPKGNYLFNMQRKVNFLKINYSNITLSGEVSSQGIPLAKLINCNKTVSGAKNPWLSPFFITTGENLQQSNIFFGLQFKKKKDIVTRSGSMSDPGSDGTLLIPELLTTIVEDAQKGTSIIKIKDTNLLKDYKYILIGMYNTTDDGNLIKDILGVDSLRAEWKTPLRAGPEKAPSYQWLIEITRIIDGQCIELSRPLLRDIVLKYEPEVYGVKMLENIAIKNLIISSKWNGIFHHHGFYRFYNVEQAQEMDYGWNAINMKRVAHGLIQNVIFDNYTNPLYVLDSRNVTTEKCVFQGPDGHQGIKVYEHTCDCLFKDIVFYNNYADMMGGEGNAYGNVFDNITYCNPYFSPVDFDFHGFSEGPMSPPSHNLFKNIHGFRNIKGAGAPYNQPACAQYNIWTNWERTGNKEGEPLFNNIHYVGGSNDVPLKYHDQFFTNSKISNINEVPR